MSFERIPDELKRLPQWVARAGKLPVNPHTLSGAKANEPATWGTFDAAAACIGWQTVRGETCDGIGFELQAPYCGMDIDHCRNPETGELTPEALSIVQTMDSYTEISPSGTGVHILYKNGGETFPDRHKKKPIDSVQHLEMYQTNRYFTMTGDVYQHYTALNQRGAAADKVYQTYMQDKPPEKQYPVRPLPSVSLPDNELLEKAVNAQNGAAFASLWHGDTGAYQGDESRADLALCSMLAFWSGGDAATVDRLFRQSGLMRPKWDRPTGATTYGAMTVAKAVAGCREFYEPKPARRTAAKPSALPDFTYEDVKKYKADDIGTSQFFSTLVRDFMCYVPEEKAFYIYNGIRWKQDVVKENLAAGRLLMAFVGKAQALIPPPPPGNPKDWTDEQAAQEQIDKAFRKHYRYLGQAAGRDSVMKDIKKRLHKPRSCFDTQPYLLNCRNGTYHLDTGEWQPHKATDYLTKCVNADYDPTAENERFTRFIDEICEGNEQQKTALQTALGYTLIGATPEECLFIALGKSTRNGKGTLFDLVLDTLGDYGAQMDFDTISRSGAKDGSRATPDLARLVGVRYVLVNEPQKGVCFNEGLVKQMTGSDTITARPLYGAPFEYKPAFTIFITSNNLPTITDDTLFQSDRIKLLLFNRHFSEAERDTGLKQTLRQGNGREAVLRWLIDGYRLYRENGLFLTDESRGVLGQYQAENDYIQQYLDERLDLGETYGRIRLTEVQRDYNDWCRDVNVRPLGKKAFTEELIKHRVTILTSHHQFVVAGRFTKE